ncbi:hypothetical protein PQR34_44735 [Paraburkholderia sediminicola]|uniref:hypothetical protein n=1 Tax=Paraburkholderia sediminicola TaxID=458836 RepID=UPI0038B7D4FA
MQQRRQDINLPSSIQAAQKPVISIAAEPKDAEIDSSPYTEAISRNDRSLGSVMGKQPSLDELIRNRSKNESRHN